VNSKNLNLKYKTGFRHRVESLTKQFFDYYNIVIKVAELFLGKNLALLIIFFAPILQQLLHYL